MVTLLVVMGLLCLTFGTLFELVALTMQEFEQPRFIRLGLYYLAAAAFFFLVYFLVFKLPEIIEERRSGVASRRRAVSKTYQRPKPLAGAPGKDEGSVLMIVLVLLGIVAATAFHAIVTARGELRLTKARLDQGLLQVTAIDIARAAMQQLADDSDLYVDSLDEEWAQPREFVDPSGTTRMVQVTDANRRFDLNNLSISTADRALLPDEVLANIMIQCGEMTPGQRIQALRDWTDSDEGGAWENNHYRTMEPPAIAGNRILYGWPELFRIEGWTPDMFAPKPLHRMNESFIHPLADGITIIPVERQRPLTVNINTAETLTLLGVFGFGREGIVERIIATRQKNPYRSVAFLGELLGQTEYADAVPYLDVKSDFFLIRATAFREGRFARLDVLARRSEDGRVDAIQAVF